MIQNPDEDAIGVTAFKGRCLSLIDDVAQGKTNRVVLMKRNKAVAMIVPVMQPVMPLWGAMRGTVALSPGTDLTQGTGEIWDADL